MTTDTVNPYPSGASDLVASDRNGAGRASLVIAIVIVAIGVVQQVVSYSVPLMMVNFDFDSSAVGVIFGLFGGLIGVLAIAGLVLGIIGLSARVAPKAAAGAGTAIAASSLLSVALGFVLPFVIEALY